MDLETAIVTGITAIIIVLIVVVAVARKGGNVNLNKDGLSLTTTKATPLPKHARCPNLRDVMAVMAMNGTTAADITMLKYTTVEEQMKFAEAVSIDVIQKMLAEFVSQLHDRGIDNPAMHKEYSQYQMTLKVIEGIIRDQFRKWFRENHFAEKSREEEADYIEKKKIAILALVTENLNRFWFGELITRPELYKVHKGLEDELIKEVDDIFRQAFVIARASDVTTKQLQQRYESFARTTITG